MNSLSSNPQKPGIQPKEIEDALYNPDVPDENLEIKSQYEKIYKNPTRARNGTFTLGNKRIFNNKSKEAFSLDNAIDPNVIRARIDPDNARPILGNQGLFSLTTASTKKPKSQVNLIRLSHESELNYRNRFEPRPSKSPQQPLSLSDLATATKGTDKRTGVEALFGRKKAMR